MPTQFETRELVTALLDQARVRRANIATVTAIRNRLGGRLRGALGWRSTEMPEAKSKSIVERAQRILERAVDGDEQDQDDQIVASLWRHEIAGMIEATAFYERSRTAYEKKLRKIAGCLPGHDFVSSVLGFGYLAAAIVVSWAPGVERDGLTSFPTIDKLFNRLGLADIKDAAWWAMTKRRRSDMAVYVGQNLLRARAKLGAEDRYYGAYLKARAKYDPRVEASANEPFAVGGERNPAKWTLKRAHAAAQRTMTKLLIEDYWKEWRRSDNNSMPPIEDKEAMPDAAETVGDIVVMPDKGQNLIAPTAVSSSHKRKAVA